MINNVLINSVGTRWMEYFADINPKDISKMRGIERMAERHQFDLNKTMSFGDGGNDISIIRKAGIGVAMGNAVAELKEAADYVTSSVDEDGIRKALEYYHVI